VASPARPPRLLFGPVPSWAVRGLVLLAAVLVVNAALLGTVRVSGASMEETLAPGDFLVVWKWQAGEPRRGDVVVFRLPENPSLVLVKRVIGVAGDRVRIAAGRVAVSAPGEPDGPDPALAAGARLAGAGAEGDVDRVVPAGAVFVLGDNRSPRASSDSRDWGLLPCRDIIGRAVLRLLPAGRLGWLLPRRGS